VQFPPACRHRSRSPTRMRPAVPFLAALADGPDGGPGRAHRVAVMEASSAVLPVVATRHAGIPEVCWRGKRAFWWRRRSSTALAADDNGRLGRRPGAGGAAGLAAAPAAQPVPQR